MYEMVELVNGILPADRPRYLMGVGTPVNILENIALGVDMFDCVMPTRNGRNGMIFTSEGVINLRNEKWKTDFSPLDPNGTSFVDSAYSRAYVRHLFMAGEMLGMRLAVMHNLYFYNKLAERIRDALDAGEFAQFRAAYSEKLAEKI